MKKPASEDQTNVRTDVHNGQCRNDRRQTSQPKNPRRVLSSQTIFHNAHRRRPSAPSLQLSLATRESRAFPNTRTASRTEKSIKPQSLHQRSLLHRFRER
ncbi:hypothetical protein HYPSUDRAFT_75667, partial [Hypholoma sublateritium FD-334 SS-4]